MRATQFLKLDKRGLEGLLSLIDWPSLEMDATKSFDFSRNILGLTEENEGILIKKGWAPIKVWAGIYGYGVIRLTIECPSSVSPIEKLYALVDFNCDKREIRRTIIYGIDDKPRWMDDGFKDVNWEEIFIKPYI